VSAAWLQHGKLLKNGTHYEERYTLLKGGNCEKKTYRYKSCERAFVSNNKTVLITCLVNSPLETIANVSGAVHFE
jgi:hypothetical protein